LFLDLTSTDFGSLVTRLATDFVFPLCAPGSIFASAGPLGSFGLTQFFRAGAGSGLSRYPARSHKSLEASPCCSGFLFECAVVSL
jgi:hypothetical protein